MPPKSPPIRMNVDEVMAELKANGTAQAAKTYRRHGAVDPIYGVSFAFLGALAKKVKRDHELATALWFTGVYDAMSFAVMIADPAQMTDAEADRWLTMVRCYGDAGSLCGVVGRSPVGLARTKVWIENPAEYTRTTGYDTLTVLLKEGVPLDADWLRWVIAKIEAEVGTSANRARHAMNMALIAIGGYRADLRDEVLAAAGRIGPIVVDHGDTSCVTPAIAPYIGKMAARAK